MGVVGALQMRFCHQGGVDDMTTTIPMIRQALNHRPSGHPLRGHTLNRLAWRLGQCYDINPFRGVDTDIQEAIVLAEEALALRNAENASLRNYELDTLARCLRRVPGRLDDALALAREALSVAEKSSSLGVRKLRWVYLQTLSMVLLSLYRQHPDKEEYREEAIRTCKEGLDTCPEHYGYEWSVLLEVESELNTLPINPSP